MFAVSTGSGQVMGFADVCKTPAPPPVGTVPVPYPNQATTSMGVPPCVKVLIAGMPALNRNAKCVPSNGDEPGAYGGVVSGIIKGPVAFVTSSMKVMVQGAPAVRLSDSTTHNNNNTVGMVLAPSQTKVLILG